MLCTQTFITVGDDAGVPISIFTLFPAVIVLFGVSTFTLFVVEALYIVVEAEPYPIWKFNVPTLVYAVTLFHVSPNPVSSGTVVVPVHVEVAYEKQRWAIPDNVPDVPPIRAPNVPVVEKLLESV